MDKHGDHGHVCWDGCAIYRLPYDFRAFLGVQRAFNDKLQRFKHGRGLDDVPADERPRIVKDLILLTIVELVEMLGHVNYKPHKKDKPQNREKLLEEYVDAFKYMLNFFLYTPFTYEEFAEAFYKKSAVVDARLDEEFVDGGKR